MIKYTLSKLIELENALRIICMKYENASKNYDGSIINNSEYSMFKKYNDFRNEVVLAIEKIINDEIVSWNDNI